VTPPAAGPVRRRSLLPLTLFAAAALAVLLALGTWQVERLAWKEALIARVDARVHAEPVDLPPSSSWPSLDPEAIEYLPVRITGTFDHARELYVFIALSSPKGPAGGQGWFVLTPLILSDGSAVLVNRGFVPDGRKDPASRVEGQVAGPVTITGLLRPAEQRNWLSPADNPEKNVWFVRDPDTMARAAGLDPAKTAPFTVDAFAGQAPGGLPQGGETIIAFPNNHLGYAITWYGLAAALVAVYAVVLRGRMKRG
jgi:surfeit locus 1 family protein